jgi:phosphate uptake regulator
VERRKIQLVAGTTYSVSLPKEWVRKNNLGAKDEIIFSEKSDRSLVIFPRGKSDKILNEITLNVDEYQDTIDQILFAIYYLGVESIKLFSKEELSKEVRSKIRKTLPYMSGTEITYEDQNKITIKVLLDKSRVNINQVIYRISLIIDSSLSSMLETDFDIGEVKVNEAEIDRLYHLVSKIVSLSLVDSNVLQSSKITNVSYVPFYFLVAKRLENLGDEVIYLAKQMNEGKSVINDKERIFSLIRTELSRAMSHWLKPSKLFKKMESEQIDEMKELIRKNDDISVQKHLEGTLRYLVDIQESLVNLSFYKKLVAEELL